MSAALVVLTVLSATPEWAHWSAFGRASTEGLAAGADAQIDGLNCDLVDVRAEGRLLITGGAAAEESLTICPYRVGIFDLEFRQGVVLEGRPQLFERWGRWQRPYSERSWGMNIDGADVLMAFRERSGELTEIPTTRLIAPTMWFDVTVVEQRGDDGQVRRQDQIQFGVSFFSWQKDRSGPLGPTRRTIDFLAVEARGVKDSSGVAVGDILPIRIRGLRLFGTAHVEVDAEAGFAGTGQMSLSVEAGEEGAEQPIYDETIVTDENLPELSVGVGKIGVRAMLRQARVDVSAGRSLYPTFDADLALEDRVTGSIVFRTRRSDVQLRAFAARTDVWTVDDEKRHERTGGAGIDVGRELNHRLRLDVTGEVARSFYANVDAGAVVRPDAAVGVRVFAALTARLSSPR